MAGSPVTLCGSISRQPVMFGAVMHQAAYEALSLSFRYVPFAVSDVAGAIAGMRALQIRGLAVSNSFKIKVLPLVDALEPLARRIGAANCVVNDSGTVTGYNTESWAAARALEEHVRLAGNRALIVGAGGVARAVAHGLAAEGMHLHIANQSLRRANELADELNPAPVAGVRVTAGGLDALEDVSGYDAVVSCANEGMLPSDTANLLNFSRMKPTTVFMDVVYKPTDTALLQAARVAGARVVSGERMVVHQSARQFELYTGAAAPLDVMADALRVALEGL